MNRCTNTFGGVTAETGPELVTPPARMTCANTLGDFTLETSFAIRDGKVVDFVDHRTPAPVYTRHACGESYSPRHPADCYYCRLALDNDTTRSMLS